MVVEACCCGDVSFSVRICEPVKIEGRMDAGMDNTFLRKNLMKSDKCLKTVMKFIVQQDNKTQRPKLVWGGLLSSKETVA